MTRMWPNSCCSNCLVSALMWMGAMSMSTAKSCIPSIFEHSCRRVFRGRPTIVRVGHPDACGQLGHHTLSDVMEDALGSNLCMHSRGDQSDSDSLFRWSLKLRFFVRTFPPPAVTASWTQAKTCLVEVVRPCPVEAPLVEQKGNLHDEALGQHLLFRQSPHLGVASLCCSQTAQINADQESTHPFTRQSHLQSFLFAEVLEEGTHDLERHTGTLTKHVSGLSASQPRPQGFSWAVHDTCQGHHGVCVHVAEDLRAPPLTFHESVFLLPAIMKSVGQAQEPPLFLVRRLCCCRPVFLLVFLNDCMSSTSKYLLNISENAHASLPSMGYGLVGDVPRGVRISTHLQNTKHPHTGFANSDDQPCKVASAHSDPAASTKLDVAR